jgi:hypothetical protein
MMEVNALGECRTRMKFQVSGSGRGSASAVFAERVAGGGTELSQGWDWTSVVTGAFQSAFAVYVCRRAIGGGRKHGGRW